MLDLKVLRRDLYSCRQSGETERTELLNMVLSTETLNPTGFGNCHLTRRSPGRIRYRLNTDSGDQFLDHSAVHVGQAEITALEAVSEFGMVEAKQVQDCGVEVMNVDRVTTDSESEFV